jgi:hypothetical protein
VRADASQGANVAKKVVLVVLTLVVGLAVYFAASWYKDAHKTPEAAAASFMEQFAAGDFDKTYQQFSDTYASQYSENSWQSYLQSLSGATSPELISSEAVVDRFNVYPEGSNPQRVVYSLQVKGRQYWVSTVILKQDGSWKIDDIQGSYK